MSDRIINESKYSRMDQAKFVKESLKNLMEYGLCPKYASAGLTADSIPTIIWSDNS